MYKSSAILLAALLFPLTIKSIIVNAYELYNPKLNQAVLLMGDRHITPVTEAEQKQIDTLSALITNYDIYNIVEAYADETQKSSYKEKAALFKFAYSCPASKLKINFAEFRDENVFYLAAMDAMSSFFPYIHIKKFISDPEKGARVVNSIDKAISLAKVKIDEVENISKLYHSILDSLSHAHEITNFHQIKQLYNSVVSTWEKIKHDRTLLIENLYQDDGQNRSIVSPHSVNLDLLEITCYLFDFFVLKDLIDHASERVILIYTGCLHTLVYLKALEAHGYELKNSITTYDLESEECENIDNFSDAREFLSPKTGQLSTIDVNEFFSNCKSLPKGILG